MIEILTIISPLFLIILATAIGQKYFRIGDDWSKVFNEFALKIGLPVLIFASLSRTSFSFKDQASLIISNSFLVITSLIFAYFLGKLLKFNKVFFRTFFICLAFSNVAYLGIPVLSSIKGAEILPQVSLIIGVYLFWIFTIGIAFLDNSIKEKNEKIAKTTVLKLIKNPLLLSCFFGIIIGYFQIQLPQIVFKSLDMISASVTPTVLIVIGLFIGKSKLGKLKDWIPIAIFSLLVLILVPGVFYLVLRTLQLNPKDFGVSIIEAAMPLAITPFALTDKYKLDKNFIAKSIVLSTILSVLTLPFWVSIL
ncbi:MAG: AEC family transporter [Candidatus Gracilibacteria bacterium]|jgi:predicted permease|nr:AEC family transporter [Candidatus Gracilibacteria bacterium]